MTPEVNIKLPLCCLRPDLMHRNKTNTVNKLNKICWRVILCRLEAAAQLRPVFLLI